jgi:hypothetical protein
VDQVLDQPVRRALPRHLLGGDDVRTRGIFLAELGRIDDLLGAPVADLGAGEGLLLVFDCGHALLLLKS